MSSLEADFLNKKHNMHIISKYSTDFLEYLNELDPLKFLGNKIGFHKPDIRRDFYGNVQQTV